MRRSALILAIGLSACMSSPSVLESKRDALRRAVAAAATPEAFIRASEAEGLACYRYVCDTYCQRDYTALNSAAAGEPDAIVQCIWHERASPFRLVTGAVLAKAYVEGGGVLDNTVDLIFTGP
jgi:hypothetical protein